VADYLAVIVGIPVTVVVWLAIRMLLQLAIRIGVTAAFRLRARGADMAQAAAGLIMAGVMLLITLICIALIWQVFMPDFATTVVGWSVTLVLAAIVLVLLGAPEWMRQQLLRSIERARSGQ
jgi:hypothetical protein